MKKEKARKNKKSTLIATTLFVVFAFFVFSLSTNFLTSDETSFSTSLASGLTGPTGDLQDGMDTSTLTPQDSAAINKMLTNAENSCGLGDLKCVVSAALIAVLKAITWLLSAAATLFLWVIQPRNFEIIATGANIYTVWQTVRDLLNIAFILVLLYSAFCQIFQVEKYSFKKIWLNFILMALLVNFSFPITRFIIDASNVLMYTILNALVPTAEGSLTAKFAEAAYLKNILAAGPASATWASLIAAIIFTFILAVTLLTMSVLLVVRMITLAVLIVLSPAAFVLTIVSGGEGISSKWWKYLFDNAFFGPAMALMLFVATKLMDATSKTYSTMVTASQKNEALDPGIVAGIGMFAVPVAVLWIGMGTAKTMGAIGSDEIMKHAKKFIDWAGKGTYKVPWAGVKKTGIPGGIQKKYAFFKDASKASQSSREARVAAMLGVKGSAEQDIKTRAEEYKKNNETVESLKQKSIRGDTAAAYRLAVDGDMDFVTYQNVRARIKDPKILELLDKKVSEKKLDVVVKCKMAEATNPDAKLRIAKEAYDKLDADGWKKQEDIHNVVDPAHADYDPHINAVASSSFLNLHADARKDVGKNSSGGRLAKLRDAGFNIP